MRAVHGNLVGQAKRSYVCRECGTSVPAVKGKRPKKCHHCSGPLVYMASNAELRRFNDLRMLERGGQIMGLLVQPSYPLHVGSEKIGTWRADFAYIEDGKLTVEDVKGRVDTHLSAWKRKHYELQYGVKVKIIQPSRR